jgi:hypothetical protein
MQIEKRLNMIAQLQHTHTKLLVQIVRMNAAVIMNNKVIK